MVRDGRDVAFSIKNRMGSIEHGLKEWQTKNLARKPFWNHPNLILVKFENLITSLEATLTDILKFLDEDYETDMLEYYLRPKTWITNDISKPTSTKGFENHAALRSWQINQPIYDSRGIWKDFPPKEVELVTNTLKPLLVDFGYM